MSSARLLSRALKVEICYFPHNYPNQVEDYTIGRYRYKFEVQGSVYFSIYSVLVVSCFMWSTALDSSDVLLSYSITSLAQHIIPILISTLFQSYKHINIHTYIYTHTHAHTHTRSMINNPSNTTIYDPVSRTTKVIRSPRKVTRRNESGELMDSATGVQIYIDMFREMAMTISL